MRGLTRHEILRAGAAGGALAMLPAFALAGGATDAQAAGEAYPLITSFAGRYDPMTAYVRGEVVTTDAGQYLALQSSSGVDPTTNDADWAPLLPRWVVLATQAQRAENILLPVLSLQPTTAGSEPFELQLNSFANAGGGAGTYNHGVWLGWNVERHSRGGAGAVSGKPSLTMGFEDNYYDDAGDHHFGVEWYVEYWSPDGVSVQQLRPLYTRVFSDDNSVNSCTTVMSIGTDGTGSWQVRTTLGGGGRPLLNVTAAGGTTVYGPGGLTVFGAITTPQLVGQSGTNRDLSVRAGSASGGFVVQNSTASSNNFTVDDRGNIGTQDGAALNSYGQTGFRIGGSGSQKFGFYGAAPVVQPTGTPTAAYDSASALKLVNSLRASLLRLGLVS